ncbi:PREDICTED: uncharacterized protein LOC106819781, partial [Priapulus caudatus]|uniref:Uncharacterized protein LOC106819781 n=1 Tax=Priapulus caudatus TaxID=37621 RepID=A0ABM1F5Y1_PRICU
MGAGQLGRFPAATTAHVSSIGKERFYEQQSAVGVASTSSVQAALTSTPMGAGHLGRFPAATTALSDVSSIGKESSERTISGIEAVQESASEAERSSEQTVSAAESILETAIKGGVASRQPSDVPHTTKSGRVVAPKMLSSSFADPFNVSIEISQVSESDNDDLYDSDYEPSFTVTAVLPDEVITATAEVPFEEMEFGMEVPDDDVGEDDTTEEVGPAIDRVKTEDDCTRITDDIVCLSFLKQIKTLANTHVTQCTHCSSPVAIEEKFVGSALYLKWICKNKHLVHEWCSQPLLNKRLHSIDFLIAASILTSGNNFHKMALWAEHLRLKFVSEATFHNIQRCYLVPTIENFWSDHQKEVVAEMKDKELVVLGDGRMDSPGYSAQYCSYTIMESESKKILTLKTLDKRVTDRKSTNMEKKGFSDALGEVMAKGLKVKEVVTDAHMAIGAFMRTQYPDVKHSNDVWHVAKNLGKKIISAGQQKGCESLQKWARDIINHFWFTCQKAQTYAEFLNIWRSVLNHVVNEHHWILPHGRGTNKCLHGPLNDDERDKPWLDRKADSEALATLAKIVLDKRFLNRVGYVLNF